MTSYIKQFSNKSQNMNDIHKNNFLNKSTKMNDVHKTIFLQKGTEAQSHATHDAGVIISFLKEHLYFKFSNTRNS